jgi:hypothetical protein
VKQTPTYSILILILLLAFLMEFIFYQHPFHAYFMGLFFASYSFKGSGLFRRRSFRRGHFVAGHFVAGLFRRGVISSWVISSRTLKTCESYCWTSLIAGNRVYCKIELLRETKKSMFKCLATTYGVIVPVTNWIAIIYHNLPSLFYANAEFLRWIKK